MNATKVILEVLFAGALTANQPAVGLLDEGPVVAGLFSAGVAVAGDSDETSGGDVAYSDDIGPEENGKQNLPDNNGDRPIELLRLRGLSLQDLIDLPEKPDDDGDHLAIMQILAPFERIPISKLENWARGSAAGKSSPGDVAVLRGRVVQAAATVLPSMISESFSMERYFRCKLTTDKGPTTTWVIYTPAVPLDWISNPELNEPASAIVLVTRSPEQDQQGMGISQRIAWHPNTLLGSAGMDVGLLDTIQDHADLRAEERECFYQMLAAVGQANLESRTQPPDSVVPLFNDPSSKRGEPVVLEGSARRCIRIFITDEEIRRRMAFDHYWEIDFFTADSQNNPLAVCLRELPRGFPTGDDIREPIRLSGFFLKSWAYSAVHDPQADAANVKQLAPLIIANSISWLPDDAESPWPILAGAGLAGLLLLIVIVVGIAWYWQRQDDRFLRQRRARMS